MRSDTEGGTITFNPARACDAVREIAKRWYKTEDIPKLPLKDCSYGGICECKYRFRDDPRQGDRRLARDRREDLRFEPGHDDRRKGCGRRAGESAWKIGI